MDLPNRRNHRPELASVAARARRVALAGGLLLAVAVSATGQTSVVASTPADPSLLVKVAGQYEPAVRREAAITLLRAGGPEIVSAFTTLLQSKGNDAAKIAIAEAIAETQIEENSFIAPLSAMLAEKDPLLRKAAATALAHYRDPVVVQKLRAFRQEQDALLLAENHATLMKALYECTPESDRQALLQAWLRQPLAIERATALDIVQQALRRGTPDTPVLDQIRTMLNDPDEAVRQRAIFVLRTRGLPDDAARIQQMLEVEQPVIVREAIYNALGTLGDARSIPVVARGLKDSSEAVAGEAASALAKLARLQPAPPRSFLEDAVTALLDRAAEPIESPRLLERLVDAMGGIADLRFAPTLIQHAGPDQPTPAVRQAALRGLGRLGDSRNLNLVVDRLTNDADAGVREAAAEAMGKLGSQREHLRVLRERLDPKVEQAASVQARAWEAYRAIFMKLSPAEQREVLSTWQDSDPTSAARRIELLSILEKQASSNGLPPLAVAEVRQELAGALIAASRPADAASVLARGVDSLSGQSFTEVRDQLAVRLVECYLLTLAVEKAVDAAATIRSEDARAAVAQRLVSFVESAQNAQAAAVLLELLEEMIPDRFGSAWASRFEDARRNLPADTRPTSRPANGG